MRDLVSVRNLTVGFVGQAAPAVDAVSFSIAPGKCLALVGESGSGKTLTARSLIGLTPASARISADELTVASVDARQLGEKAWRRLRGAVIGLVSQDALVALDPLRRVGAEVAEALQVHEKLSKVQQRERVLGLLQQTAVPQPELRARQYPHELSGGLRQRALIASPLAGGPALLIADEPTTALDASVQAQILDLLSELKQTGLALLVISHDLSVVQHIADRVAVMRGGRILEQADTTSLFAAPKHEYTRALLGAAAAVRGARPASVTLVGGASAPKQSVVLSANGLVKSYRRSRQKFRAVDGIDFDLQSRTTLGVVGGSGSGKTTLAKILLGIESPDHGEVLLNGEAWSGLAESRRRNRRGRIQLIHQNPRGVFDPLHTVRRILAQAVALDGVARRLREARILELLAAVALGPELLHRRAHQLSGGQLQRVAIARALARRPEVLVCDEPVSALDVTVQAQVIELLAELQRSMGLAMVFISHDLSVVRSLSHQVLVMADGVVVERGTADELFERPQHPVTKELLAASGANLGPVSDCAALK